MRPATCPACSRPRTPGQYLCRGCWRQLSAPARRLLLTRDRWSVRRLQSLLEQIRAGVPLADIRIEATPKPLSASQTPEQPCSGADHAGDPDGPYSAPSATETRPR